MKFTAKLNYFKNTGKWYAEAELETERTGIWEIWEDVQDLMQRKRLPGLIENHSDFIVHVEVPDHPHDHPVLLFPK